MNRITRTLFFICLMASASTYADSLESAAMDLCDKIRTCSMQEMEKNAANMPPQIKAMVEQSINSMCETMKQDFPDQASHPLADDAMKCMRSMADMSCEEMTSMDETTTPACEAYRKKLEEQGL